MANEVMAAAPMLTGIDATEGMTLRARMVDPVSVLIAALTTLRDASCYCSNAHMKCGASRDAPDQCGTRMSCPQGRDLRDGVLLWPRAGSSNEEKGTTANNRRPGALTRSCAGAFATMKQEEEGAMERREYCILEWLWDLNNIRINHPGGTEENGRGSYAEVVQTLTNLGQQGWKLSTCVASANWVLWTLERQK